MWFLFNFVFFFLSFAFVLVWAFNVLRRNICIFILKHICSFSHDEKLRHVSCFRESDQWIFLLLSSTRGVEWRREREKKLSQKLLKLRYFLMKNSRMIEKSKQRGALTRFLRRPVCHMMQIPVFCAFSSLYCFQVINYLHQSASYSHPSAFTFWASLSKHSIIWIPKNLWEFQQAARHFELEMRGERKDENK